MESEPTGATVNAMSAIRNAHKNLDARYCLSFFIT